MKTKNTLKTQKGFISLVALIVFTLLAVFGLIVHRTTMDTIVNIKNTNNYYQARNIASSTMEYMQYILKDHEAGYNAEVNCLFGGENDTSNTVMLPDGTSSCADEFGALVGDADVEIKMNIKGRASELEKVTGPFNPLFTEFYTVPLLKEGTAGKNCKAYILDQPYTSISTADIDNPCNWNKLQSGSDTTSRVVIPLYYEDASDNIIKLTETSGALHFALRVRTPCIKGAEEYFGECDDTERYELDDGWDGFAASENDVVVQWQIVGEEGEILPNIKFKDNGISADNSTDISEYRINKQYPTYSSIISHLVLFDLNSVLNNLAIYTVGYELPKKLSELLLPLTKPTLILSLNDKLISNNGSYIPYLEYQLITVAPVSQAKTNMETTVTVNGNQYTKTLYKSNQSDLIDFAVQN